MLFSTVEREFIGGAVEIIALHPEIRELTFWEVDDAVILWAKWVMEDEFTNVFFVKDEHCALIMLDSLMNSVIDAYPVLKGAV